MQAGRIASALIVTMAVLAGCSDTLRMQAASVARLDDGTEWVMTGTILVDFELSSMTRLSGSGLACEMPMVLRVDRAGAGRMTCRDDTGAEVYAEDHIIPAGVYGTSVRGTFVDRIDTVQGPGQMAFGWGSYADPDILRTLLE
ncbi:hypothetical protein DZD18_02295 [Rhodobacteraceae bacterium W635]|uniref:hypothetical protein n=1 Tax=Nioella halotolerans TaxID=2303578 RepID=UPI000E939103|nr:hypothetical protein DZD18_02295 [Rhodobacteraceae bacterium W635]